MKLLLVAVLAFAAGLTLSTLAARPAHADDLPPCSECGDTWPIDCMPEACKVKRLPGPPYLH